ncbi:type VII secretion system (Wss) protein ESAT-6 [Promicromonospora sp. AC04]|uniref:WXG100 family type VII secretion target n=1 Tax=Promicromonospora sp. AC04 TaxID=2135723 RepID=UPI000D336A4F|nr:WXG100 family type VII secretion target [Promicromonospora sp. AC04]PUB30139.1 type VII secretion system (Wss) protein ESAT-6 [Promicromonospora sp. AC04]
MVAEQGNVFGLDVEAVRSLANTLRTQAEGVRQVVTSITAQMAQTQWSGSDAVQFQEEWDGTHATKLNEIAAALETYGTTADNNAQMQEETSSSY